MAGNRIANLNATKATGMAKIILQKTGAEEPNEWGIPLSVLLRAESLADETASAQTAAFEAEVAYRAALRNRDTLNAELVRTLATIANGVYANPQIGPEKVAALGLRPRSTHRTRIAPCTPFGLSVVPTANRSVVLKWERYANPRNTNYIVEARVGSEGWTYAGDTRANRITLPGYGTGGRVLFRVRASRLGIVSAPSAPASLYGEASSD